MGSSRGRLLLGRSSQSANERSNVTSEVKYEFQYDGHWEKVPIATGKEFAFEPRFPFVGYILLSPVLAASGRVDMVANFMV